MAESTRGAHLLDATTRLIAKGGLAAVSIRAVAAEAGVSLAQVQYYFRTKEALVDSAFARHSDQFLAELSGLLDQPVSLDRLGLVVERWLPLDPAREERARVWLAYAGTAAVDPAVGAESGAGDEAIRDWFQADLAALVAAGQLHDVDPAVTAAQLLALIDGVCVQALALPLAERPALVAATVTPFLVALATP